MFVGVFFQGIFTRIMRTYPIDYYWIWTPEGMPCRLLGSSCRTSKDLIFLCLLLAISIVLIFGMPLRMGVGQSDSQHIVFCGCCSRPGKVRSSILKSEALVMLNLVGLSALAAHDAVNASFELGTCGWVVGPLPGAWLCEQC